MLVPGSVVAFCHQIVIVGWLYQIMEFGMFPIFVYYEECC